MQATCKVCGKPGQPGRRGPRAYCGQACWLAWVRERNHERARVRQGHNPAADLGGEHPLPELCGAASI
jgi:hypothetical protein